MEKNEDANASEEPNYRGIKAMPFVIGNETFEKLGTVGASSNLLVYLTAVFHMNSIAATNLINIFNGSTNLATLLGAFLSDAYFGRYKTLGFASISSFLGMLVLTLTSAISTLHPPHCEGEQTSFPKCKGPTTSQMAFLLTGFGLLVIGAGGIRPCNLAFGADQFNPKTESGKRGMNSFFNWYYFTYTFAMMVSLTVIIYVQSDISWALGLAIPTILMLLSCATFFLGTRMYVIVRPEGSPLTNVVQVVVASFKKRHVKLPKSPWVSLFNHLRGNSINAKLPYTDQFRFLSKAATIDEKDEINPDGSASNPWTLCSIQQVEEVKCLLRVIPIWASGIIYYVSIVQQQTFVVFQALQSNRHLGNTKFKIPAASYVVFTMLSLTVWLPIYDRIIVPFLRRIGRKENGISILQKMGVGMVLSIATMFVSALFEEKRRTLALSGYALSGLWLIPQLTLAGLSEAFTLIGEVEFFYKEFPENMRSIGGSFLFCGLAGSSYLSSFLVSIIHRMTRNASSGNWLAEDLNKGRLDYFYYLIAGLEVLNFGYFLVCAKWFKYKGTNGHTQDKGMEEMISEKPII